MTDLPPGWQATTTDALFDFVTSGSRGWARYYSRDGALFLRVGNLRRGSIAPDLAEIQRVSPPEGAEGSRTRVASNDILISITADLGRVALMADVGEPAYINQHVALARPTLGVHPRYLAWYLTSETVQRQWARQQRGATKLGLGLNDIRSIDTPLPPLPEQERIVAAIEKQFSRVDAGMAALERVRKNLRRVRVAVLQAAVTGELVPHSLAENVEVMLERIAVERRAQWKAYTPKAYKEPIAPDSFPLAVPSHWRIASLQALTHPVRVICYGILMPKENVSNGIQYVRVKDLKGWTIDVRGLKRTSHEIAAKYTRASLKSGDLLLAIRGSYGRAAIVPSELDGANITQDSARIAAHEAIDRRYLLYYLGGSVANRYYQSVARGVAVKGVNIGDLRSMPVPVPPHDEQVTIANEVERQFTLLNQIEATVDAAMTRGSSLRSSILAAAFSGRLVSQDPEDEPASILLERIAHERAASNRGRRSTKAVHRTEVVA
jgi:type I restriction enzyme, S subunit